MMGFRYVLPALFAIACSNGLKPVGTDADTDPPDVDTDVIDTGLEEPAPVDRDGDGFPEGSDCNDNDGQIFPGAPERCNGLDDDCDNLLPVSEQDRNGNGVPDCAETCGTGPTGGYVNPLLDCEYTPSPTGTPFSTRVEWAMTHQLTDATTGRVFPAYNWAEYDGYGGAFQAPVVMRVTDDDNDGDIDEEDIPDIVVVMGHFDEYEDGVLRVISGDGTRVHASKSWQTVTNALGTHDYAPYHYAGVAVGNLDADKHFEVVTTVVRRSDNLCYPAIYEVRQQGGNVTLALDKVASHANYLCGAHAPALADVDSNGQIEIIYGKALLDTDLNRYWYGAGGRGWYGQALYTDGYWNSGYHSFAYDIDGDGSQMEIVAGSTIYRNDGSVYCELGAYVSGTWTPAKDGYPAIADLRRFSGDTLGEPEIVLTGNSSVSVYHGSRRYDPNGQARCVQIAQLPNAPELDPAVSSGLPNNPNCDATRPARGGPATIADFDGDGDREFAAAGSCWYSVYQFDENDQHRLKRYALAQTLDWSSASTGSTVFDFDGDGRAEVVFSDELALYVWGVDTRAGLQPWQRLTPYLVDTNHKSWTIHEYPLVADVDNDGKAEIVAVNTHNPTNPNRWGIYVLGAYDDDWVTARPSWNQHAYHVTNLNPQGQVSYARPNYAPYTPADFNSFRQQEPGTYGALSAPNLTLFSSTCQAGCGDLTVWIEVANEGAYVATGPNVVLALYGVKNGQRFLIAQQPLGRYVQPTIRTSGYEFVLTAWSQFDHLLAVIDDPALSGPLGGDGLAKECDESDNELIISFAGACP